LTGETEARSAARASLAIAPGVLLAGFAGGIVFPILPLVGIRAGLPLPFIGLILAANRATRVVSSPLVGALTDRIGGRRTLLAGLCVQLVVMSLYTLGLVTGRPGLFFLLGRLLHGPGSACVFVAGQALALHAGGRAHGGRAASTVRAALSLGVPFGLVAGGILSDRLGNIVTFGAAIAGIALALLFAGWLTPDLRVEVERRSEWAELREALRDRRLLAIGALNFAVAFTAQGMVLSTLSLVVHERGISLCGFGEQGTSAMIMGLFVVASVVVMPVAGRWGDRARAHGAIALAGLLLLVPSLALIALWPTLGGLLLGLTVMGVATGGQSPSLLALVGAVVPQERRGRAVGILQLCSDAGGTLGPLVGTALFAGSLRAPYLATAVLLAACIPFATRLLRIGTRP
jgi:MFS family permease